MAAASPTRSSPWLHGPVSDLALGTGIIYVLAFVVLLWTGVNFPTSLVPLVVLGFATPHLGATLLRVYESAANRNAYRFFSVWVTIGIFALFLSGLRWYTVGSILITFYLTVVPWHFTGQNYGIALIFLRRRGYDVAPPLKRYIYASFLIPYALWIVALHGDAPGTAEYAPLGTAGTVYSFIPIGIPGSVQGVVLMALMIAYVWVVGECVIRVLKRASMRDALPTFVLMATQFLWFGAPIVIRIWLDAEAMGPLAPLNAAHTFVWVTMSHSVQYLWITSYYARREQPGMRTSRYFLRTLLAGSAVYGFPLLLLSPGVLGNLSFDSGLYLMVAGALNVHHIMLDGVIWKLRDTRIANVLIRGADAAPEAGSVPRRRSWIRPLIWSSGAISVLLTIGSSLETQFGVGPALERKDVQRLDVAVRRLTWMGRDDADLRSRLGTLKLERGDISAALEDFERSIELEPNPLAWLNIGVMREREGRAQRALEAYEAALLLAPDDVTALFYAGRASFRIGDAERAQALLTKAAEGAPERRDIRRLLDSVTRSVPAASSVQERGD